MTRTGLRVAGSALIAYGLVGTILLVAIGATMLQPLDEIGGLTSSLGDQRTAALESLERASETISRTSASVRNMETSVAQARLATDRASEVSRSLGGSMRQIGEQMAVTIFGLQPLISLRAGFDQTAGELELLADDVGAIGEALASNQQDARDVASALEELGGAIGRLRVAVAASPDLGASIGALEPLRLGVLALVGWLLVAALASIVTGVGLWWLSRGVRYQSSAHSIVD